jgi:hypothetical protein
MAKNYKQVNDEKQSFIIYKSWEEAFTLLSDAELAQMFKNLFLWHRNEQPTLNTPSLQLVWKLIQFNLIQNAENYDRRSETSSKNGKLGGAPKGNKNALKQKYDEFNQPNQPNSTYNNPNDNDNGNDNVDVNEYDKEYDNVDGNGNDKASVDEYSSTEINVDSNPVYDLNKNLSQELEEGFNEIDKIINK